MNLSPGTEMAIYPVHLALPGLVCVSTCVCWGMSAGGREYGGAPLGTGLEAVVDSGQDSALPQFRPDKNPASFAFRTLVWSV